MKLEVFLENDQFYQDFDYHRDRGLLSGHSQIEGIIGERIAQRGLRTHQEVDQTRTELIALQPFSESFIRFDQHVDKLEKTEHFVGIFTHFA